MCPMQGKAIRYTLGSTLSLSCGWPVSRKSVNLWCMLSNSSVALICQTFLGTAFNKIPSFFQISFKIYLFFTFYISISIFCREWSKWPYRIPHSFVVNKVSDPIETLIHFLHEPWRSSFISIDFSSSFRASFRTNFLVPFSML